MATRHNIEDHGKLTEHSYEETLFSFCSVVRSPIPLCVCDLTLLIAQ